MPELYIGTGNCDGSRIYHYPMATASGCSRAPVSPEPNGVHEFPFLPSNFALLSTLSCSTLSRSGGGGGWWDILGTDAAFSDAKSEKRSRFCD